MLDRAAIVGRELALGGARRASAVGGAVPFSIFFGAVFYFSVFVAYLSVFVAYFWPTSQIHVFVRISNVFLFCPANAPG